MDDRLANLAFHHRTNKNLQAATDARNEARAMLIELLALPYLAIGYDAQRKAYFASVRKYADLSDQTFEAALASMF